MKALCLFSKFTPTFFSSISVTSSSVDGFEQASPIEQRPKIKIKDSKAFESLQLNSINVSNEKKKIKKKTLLTSSVILPHYHSDLPDTWITLGWTRSDHTFVIDCIIQRIRIEWRLVLENGHRTIVGEIRFIKHLKHLVTANL